MAKNANFVSHKKSKLKNQDGSPQLPVASALVEGEIAINFGKDVETLSIKNESGDVVTFSSDNYYTEKKLGSGFTGANSAVTVTEALENAEIHVDQVIDSGTSASTNAVATKAVYDKIVDTELVWTNAYVAMSGAVSSHTVNTNIHLANGDREKIDSIDTLSGTVTAHTANTEIHVTSADKEKLHTHDNKSALDAITGNVGTMAYENKTSYSSATEVSTALGNKAETTALTQVNNTLTAHTADTTIHVTAADKTAWNAKVDASAIADFFDDAKYEDSGTTKVINFYHGNTIKATVDVSDFIVDGMVDDVRIENGNLVIDFNTASGKQDISIPLTDIFDPSNYYNKTEIDNLVGSGFTSSSITDVIIENEEIVSAALTDLDGRKLDASAYTPTDLSNYDTKDEVNAKIESATSGKVDTSAFNTYSAATKTVIDSKLDTSAYTPTDLSNYYKKSETSGASEISTALGGKSDTGHTHAIGDITNLQTTLDSKANTATTLAGYSISDAYTKSETSGATEISNALSEKVNTSDIISAITPSNSGSTAPIATKVVAENELTVSNALNDLNAAITAHTASTVHMNGTEKTNLDSLATNIGTISGITSTDKLIHETMNRRTRTNFTSKGLEWFKTTLKSAIADKSLEKYGLKVGDYCTATHNGKTYNYVIAGLNTMRGTSTPYRLNYDHVGIIVDTNDTHAWNTSNSTATSQNTHLTGGTWTTGTAAAGYASCDLQYYLETTVLLNVKTDLGSGNIKSHYKLYSTAVNTSGYNRFGSAGGCSSSWAWYANQEICALSEVQVYGSIVWSSSGYDTGEACRQLDVFRVYNMNEIFEGRYPWLRDVASSSRACHVGGYGFASYFDANSNYYVAALILFA